MRGLYIQHECVPAPPGRARAQPLTFSMTALPKASRCRARTVVRILRKARNKQQLFDGAPRISNIRRCCLFLKIRGDGGGNSVTEPMHPSRPRRAASSGKCIPMLQSSSLPSDSERHLMPVGLRNNVPPGRRKVGISEQACMLSSCSFQKLRARWRDSPPITPIGFQECNKMNKQSTYTFPIVGPLGEDDGVFPPNHP